ncbi:chemotaxis response regulator protein-glutamate methylesterase [Candidatus Eisenbacteria bacterium]|uniref:Protein-glutamate methylesterase/protein-glutamine glutaminase n=1 Tax=Eiseniibacteriota bacterium TaxID=2212470 RepID=A0ABV6YI27_UNCEI
MIRVLIVDDSVVVCRVLQRQLADSPEIEVVGTAPDPYVAREKILKLKPDVLTLDIEMPRMDGLTFLRKLMSHYPLPVIVISSVAQKGSQNAIEALRLGAVDILPKPSGGPEGLQALGPALVRLIKAAAASRVAQLQAQVRPARRPVADGYSFAPGRIVVIGASTGGTLAIEAVLQSFPVHAPATLLIQHMPAQFTPGFADGLDHRCAVKVREARHGDELIPGLALLAPGGFHMTISRTRGGSDRIELNKEPEVHYQRPAVDITFRSAASFGRNAVGILLTGMGADGAEGLWEMRQEGARTIAQDETTSVVFGMPKAAIQQDAAQLVLPLHEIATAALRSSSLSRGAA